MQLCNNWSCLYSKKSRKHHTIYPWLFTSQCLNSSFKIWSSFHLHSSFSWWWSNQTRFWLVVHECNSFKLNPPQSCKQVKPNFRIQICAVMLFNLIQHWRANESNSHIGLNLYRSATTGGWHVDNLLSSLRHPVPDQGLETLIHPHNFVLPIDIYDLHLFIVSHKLGLYLL